MLPLLVHNSLLQLGVSKVALAEASYILSSAWERKVVICAADFFLSLWLEQLRNGLFIRKSITVYGNLAARPHQ